MEIPYRYKHNTSSFLHYWTNGVGKDLLQNLGHTPNLEKAKELIPLLYQWDKDGDQVILDLYLKNGFSKGNESLNRYIDKKSIPNDELLVWDRLFKSFEIEPNWLDHKKLNIGSELSRRAGLSALIVLRNYCLMGGYESAAINKPLIYTGALKKGAVKRLTDTVDFWVLIHKENAFFNSTVGLKQVFMTRMIHSYSRVNILAKTDWDSAEWGIPINSWDMLATNLGFSLVFLIGLRRTGIKPSEEEIEGLFHFWKYVGYLLGIPLSLLPNNEQQAIESLYYWTMTQREGDQDTIALADALKEEPIQAFYPPNKLMRKMMREIHLFYNQFYLGDYSCELLKLPKTTIGRFGLVNIWKMRRNEAKIVDEESRKKAILAGAEEQENVRKIYQKYNN